MIWRCDLVPQFEAYKEEINEAIQKVLMSGRYILNEEVSKFEEEFAAYVGSPYAVSVANATDGLTLSLMVKGIGQGDEVITTPFTAIPTVSAIVDAGATPVFVDIEKDSYLMDITKVKDKITPRTKAIMAVHIFGNVIDIPALRNIVGNDMLIIEDASQAHGSKMNQVHVGVTGEIGVFSFYPSKNLGAYGDGGMIITQNEETYNSLKLLRMYGMTDYNHIVRHGINSRLDELQAAILRIKLRHLDEMNDKRNVIAAYYKENLKPNLFDHQEIPRNVYSNYHVFVSRFKGNRQKFIDYLYSHDIQTNIYYLLPLHLQKANEFLGYKPGDFPVAEQVCNEVIALTLYPELEKQLLVHITDVINNYQE